MQACLRYCGRKGMTTIVYRESFNLALHSPRNHAMNKEHAFHFRLRHSSRLNPCKGEFYEKVHSSFRPRRSVRPFGLHQERASRSSCLFHVKHASRSGWRSESGSFADPFDVIHRKSFTEKALPETAGLFLLVLPPGT